jgi:hypothetical protein
MATIQANKTPGSRTEVGDSILQAAKKTNTKIIAPRLTAFAKIHAAYLNADAEVKDASAALRAQQEKVADADVEQDAAIQGLAAALAGEGLPRANPFKPLGFPAPSAICVLGYAKQATEVQKLAAAVSKRQGAGKASRAAAKSANAAAKRVLAAIKPIARLEKARTDAMTRRDTLEQPWETALAALKRGARAAEDDGAKGLFHALFDRGSAKKTTKPRSKSAPNAASPTP